MLQDVTTHKHMINVRTMPSSKDYNTWDIDEESIEIDEMKRTKEDNRSTGNFITSSISIAICVCCAREPSTDYWQQSK